MVQFKLSVLFILVAAAIVPTTVALPVPGTTAASSKKGTATARHGVSDSVKVKNNISGR